MYQYQCHRANTQRRILLLYLKFKQSDYLSILNSIHRVIEIVPFSNNVSHSSVLSPSHTMMRLAGVLLAKHSHLTELFKYVNSTTWTLLGGLYQVDSTRWTLLGGLYQVDSTMWTLPCGLYHVDSTRWTLLGGLY